MYPTLFVPGMIWWKEVRRGEYTFDMYLVKLLRGLEYNHGALGHPNLCTPDRYPALLALLVTMTNLIEKTPLTQIIHVINKVYKELDSFWVYSVNSQKYFTFNLLQDLKEWQYFVLYVILILR